MRLSILLVPIILILFKPDHSSGISGSNCDLQPRMPPLMLAAGSPTELRWKTACLLMIPRVQETAIGSMVASVWICSLDRIYYFGILASSSKGMLTEFMKWTMLQWLLGRTSRRSLVEPSLSMKSDHEVCLTQGTGFFWQLLYLAQSQSSILSLSAPQAMQLGCFFLSYLFLNSHLLPSQVSSLPSREEEPVRIIFSASVARISPTSPGSIPITPRVEQPPKLIWSLPHRHRQHGDSPPQQVICAYQPMHAPLSNFLLLFMQWSLTMYLQVGLSDPSITRSQSSSR